MREKGEGRGRRQKRAWAMFVLVLTLGWLPGQGVGLGAVGKEFLIAPGPVFPYTPAVAYDPASGRFLVVYQRSVGADLRGRLLDASGKRVGSSFIISSDVFGSSVVAFEEANQSFLVVWMQVNADVGGGNIWGRRVGTDGTFLGARFAISTGNGVFPSVAYDPAGRRFLVVWEGGEGIYARLVGADGSLLGGEIVIGTGPGGNSQSAVAYDPANRGFLVVWEGQSELDLNGPNVYGRRVGSNGSLPGERFKILSNPFCHTRCTVAYDATHGRFLVAWATRGSDGSGEIVGRLVEANGTLLGTPFSLSIARMVGDLGISAAYDPVKGRFLVVWGAIPLGKRFHGSEGGLYGRQVNADGSLFPDREQPVAARPLGWSPGVAHDSVNRRFLVVWTPGESSAGGLHGLLLADLPVEGGRLGISSKKLSFSQVEVGGAKSRSLVLKNGGKGELYGRMGTLDGPFGILSGGGDFTLGSGESKTVTVQFAPTDPGRVTSVLEITSTDPKQMSVRVQVSGAGK